MSHKLAVTLVAACLFIPPLALAAGPGGGTGLLAEVVRQEAAQQPAVAEQAVAQQAVVVLRAAESGARESAVAD